MFPLAKYFSYRFQRQETGAIIIYNSAVLMVFAFENGKDAMEFITVQIDLMSKGAYFATVNTSSARIPNVLAASWCAMAFSIATEERTN